MRATRRAGASTARPFLFALCSFLRAALLYQSTYTARRAIAQSSLNVGRYLLLWKSATCLAWLSPTPLTFAGAAAAPGLSPPTLGGLAACGDVMSNVANVTTTTTNTIEASANAAVSRGRWSNLAIITFCSLLAFIARSMLPTRRVLAHPSNVPFFANANRLGTNVTIPAREHEYPNFRESLFHAIG